MNEKTHPVFGDVTYNYSRQQAIADGVLIDLTPWAREAGFKIPVACTNTVWTEVITPPKSATGQSQRGRAHDLLRQLYLAITQTPAQPTLLFGMIVDDRPAGLQRTIPLTSMAHGGDQGEVVITVMQPDED